MKKSNARDNHDFRYVTKMVSDQQCCRQCAYFNDCVDSKGSDPVCENFESVNGQSQNLTDSPAAHKRRLRQSFRHFDIST